MKNKPQTKIPLMAKKITIYIILMAILIKPITTFAEITKEDYSLFKEDITEINIENQKYTLLIGTGLTLGALIIDDETKKQLTHSKSGINNTIADFGNIVGNPFVDFSASFLMYTFSKKDTLLERASFTAMESVLIATTVTEVLAFSIGRKRPYQTESSTHFKPLSGSTSFPSGHAASSMALASTYAKYYNEPYSYLLYTIYAATAFGRIYKNKHYLSDVIMGGTIGYATSSYLCERHKKNQKTTYIPIIILTDKTLFLGITKQI